jgi:hypothetical protein
MELINKDAVVAEIKKRIRYYQTKNQKWGVAGYAGRVAEGEEILDYINTLEVKEVDLDKIIKEEYLKQRCYREKDNMLVILTESDFNRITKHFFELGLKAAQKGE